MTFMLSGNYLSVLSVAVKNNKDEQDALAKIRESVKTFYDSESPKTPLKLRSKSWTNDQIWKFYVIPVGDNNYTGLAKTLLIDKKVQEIKNFEKFFSDSHQVELHRIMSADEFEKIAAELM